MANNTKVKLSELPSKDSLSPDDILIIDDGEKSYSLQYSALKSDIEQSSSSFVNIARLSNKVDNLEEEISPEIVVGLFSADTSGTTIFDLDDPLVVGRQYKFTITNSNVPSGATYRVYLDLGNITRDIGTIQTNFVTNYILFVADRSYDKVRVSGVPYYSLAITYTESLVLNKPLVDGSPSDGNAGQYLRSLGDGSTEWVDLQSPLQNFKDAEYGGTVEGLVGDSIPEQYRNKATGKWAHAEGGEMDDRPGHTPVYYPTTASGQASHAEGSESTASGHYSHAEGCDGTVASGIAAHAEGSFTTASGVASHAEGIGTIANHRAQHVFGEFNIPDDSTASSAQAGNYLEIVGNGHNTVGTKTGVRSNARTLDWNGNEVLAGGLTIGGPFVLGDTTLTQQLLATLLAGVTKQDILTALGYEEIELTIRNLDGTRSLIHTIGLVEALPADSTIGNAIVGVSTIA